MSRPRKCCRISFLPDATYFKPAGIPLKDLTEVALSLEEVEALRLKDLEGLEQGGGAGKMNVSRPTFQRILASARRKVADALLNGKAIHIEGGNFEIAKIRFRCHNGHEWDAADDAVNIIPGVCPTCHTENIGQLPVAARGTSGRGRGHGYGTHGRENL